MRSARASLLALSCLGAALAAQDQAAFRSPDAEANLAHARELLAKYQLIDTHVDTPQVMRVISERPMEMIPNLEEGMLGQFDLARARSGGMGGAFFTVWAPCQDQIGIEVGPDFQNPDWTVRDTIESIDLIKEMIEAHNATLGYAESADEAEEAFRNGKMAAMIGMEGTHMLGNSLSTIRIMYRLGVRYLTLAHVCHSSFASSCGTVGLGQSGSSVTPIHKGNGLTTLGRELVKELNRLGIMVDLSHTSKETMLDVLGMTDVPVVWTHAGARGVTDHPRNVPDEVLDLIGPGKNEGVIQSVFVKRFIDPVNATIPRVVDHVEYIASRTSKKHVGLASDFDGMNQVVQGLEDVSRWPWLIAEFVRRGWTDPEIHDLMSGNLLRVMRRVEAVAIAKAGNGEKASTMVYDRRTDLPGTNWGGPGGSYLPPNVKELVDRRRIRDEL